MLKSKIGTRAAKGLACLMLIATTVIFSSNYAHAENFVTRYDEGTFGGNYFYTVALSANTEQVTGDVSYIRDSVPLQVKMEVARANQLGHIYEWDYPTSHVLYRAASTTWLRNNRLGEAALVKSMHYINGSNVKEFHLDQIDIPSAFIAEPEETEETTIEP